MPEFLLLPRPKSVTWTGGWVDVAASNVHEESGAHDDRTIRGQSYELRVRAGNAEHEPARIEIKAGGQAGLGHAHATLAQLRRQFGDRIPCVEIVDEPTFPKRGFMLDISRCRVPTMEFLFEVVRTLASFKMNHLQLYTEHTFAYAGHDIVWRDASPITPAEAIELDSYCQQHGIELAANQNTFGHFERWLSHERYEPLAEIPRGHAWDFGGHPMIGPFSLNPADPRCVQLVGELLDQLLPCLTSPLVNIGCDETLDVGRGRSRNVVAERGRSQVYAEYVRRIMNLVMNHHKRPMFWADIALSEPGILNELPGDAIALAWGYEADTPFGDWCDAIRAAGHDAWVCPGTSAWRSITGRTAERRANISTAAIEGAAHRAVGFLLTEWGDMGHRQQWPITLHAIAEGANAAWNADSSNSFDARASSLHAFNDDSLTIGHWIDELGDVDRELRLICGPMHDDGRPTPVRNSTVLFNSLHPPAAHYEPRGTIDQWKRVRDRLPTMVNRLAGRLPPFMLEELRHTVEVAMLASHVGFHRAFPGMLGDRERDWMAWAVGNIVDEHRWLWDQRSRPGGFDESCGHYESLYDVIEKLR